MVAYDEFLKGQAQELLARSMIDEHFSYLHFFHEKLEFCSLFGDFDNDVTVRHICNEDLALSAFATWKQAKYEWMVSQILSQKLEQLLVIGGKCL